MAKRANWEPGVGFTRRTMSRTGAASGSLWKGVQVVSATSSRRLDEMKADSERHREDHQHTAAIEQLEGEVSQAANMMNHKMNQLERKAEQVAEENERLRRELETRATKGRRND